jgi:aspartate/methionine/tyrosine aminotransferase
MTERTDFTKIHRSFGVADRLAPFGTTIFAEMSALAKKHNAINLSQGFPDFDGPAFIQQAAQEAIAKGHNQYAPMPGIPELRRAIAADRERRLGTPIEADTEVTVTAGCTEAINAAMLGIVNPGDPVVVFEPYYDCYRAALTFAQAEPRFVALRAPGDEHPNDFWYDDGELAAAFSGVGPDAHAARAILLNTPHNPTGKVFTEGELDRVAALCQQHDAIAITDEVYEHLTYDPDVPHIALASRPGMADRTVSLSSLGKTHSLTGWKIGWAVAPAHLTAGVRAAHQFLTYSIATPLQFGAAAAIEHGDADINALCSLYRSNRDQVVDALNCIGIHAVAPRGTYFVMGDHTEAAARLGLPGDDVSFCRYLTEHVGVAAIPPSVFYDRPELGAHLTRFAFCKRPETMAAAIERLQRINSG